ncbi:MAG: phosphoenolpyruvate-protein phosphotransferase PtsP, partial [Gammaproteobacteria bacterium]
MALEAIQGIGRAIGLSRDPIQAVATVVSSIRHELRVDVCSIYLYRRREQSLWLVASEGLRPEVIGKLTLRAGEGLVGLVAERLEPVNTDDAPSHPAFRFFPESGEALYHAFLGLPIIYLGELLGVLVVQQRERRRFSDEDLAFLTTLAIQIAGPLHHAKISGAINRSLSHREASSDFLPGIAAAQGVAVGTIRVIRRETSLDLPVVTNTDDPVAESRRFRRAVTATRRELRAAAERAARFLPEEELALFEVHQLLLSGDGLVRDTQQRIRSGMTAAAAWVQTLREHLAVFEAMEDPYLRTRAEDLRDLGHRVMRHLQEGAGSETAEYPPNCILAAEEIGLPELTRVPQRRLAAILCNQGSELSHAALLARTLGIPAVMGLKDLPLDAIDGASAVVDGYEGRVCINPSPAVRHEFRRLLRDERALDRELKGLREEPAVTPDGYRLRLLVNAGLLTDLQPVRRAGAEGIGLYRTEFPFMRRDAFPTEEEQYRTYRKVLRAVGPQPVTMRTLDIGGDKPLPYFRLEEENPQLGLRGIRLTLAQPEILITQLRALLRADCGLGNLRLCFPMVTSLAELDSGIGHLRQVLSELRDEGHAVEMPPLGIMIEVPSMLFLLPECLDRVDFICIGTNDLTQYLLAVDRDNPGVAPLFDELNPAVLRALKQLVDTARRRRVPVTVCGEMAADPEGAVLLTAMGVDSLSVNAALVPRLKWLVRNISRRRMRRLLERVIECEDPGEIRQATRQLLQRAGL